MSALQHTPGRMCDACEGFCLQLVPAVDAGIEISLRIGQHVRHHDYKGQRVTGTVRGISVDSDRVLMADIVLDAPIVIVIPAHGDDGDREISLWHQHVPAHELSAFDDRDEVIGWLLTTLAAIYTECAGPGRPFSGDSYLPPHLVEAARLAIAKVTGA